MILRKSQDNKYRFMGSCHMHGYMDSEALDVEGLADEEIVVTWGGFIILTSYEFNFHADTLSPSLTLLDMNNNSRGKSGGTRDLHWSQNFRKALDYTSNRGWRYFLPRKLTIL